MDTHSFLKKKIEKSAKVPASQVYQSTLAASKLPQRKGAIGRNKPNENCG
jgi:hypothetical protein